MRKQANMAMTCGVRLVVVSLLAAAALAAVGPVRAQDQDPILIKIPADPLPPGSAPGDADKYYNQGNEAFNKGDYASAISAFTRAIEIKSVFSDANFNRGVAYAALKDWKSAQADFTVVIRRQPRMYDAFVERGRANGMLGDSDAADKDFAKAIELKPQRPAAYETRGQFEYERKRYANAITDCDAALSAAPIDPITADAAHKLRGMAETRLGRKIEALADLRPYVKSHPTDDEAAAALLAAEQI